MLQKSERPGPLAAAGPSGSQIPRQETRLDSKPNPPNVSSVFDVADVASLDELGGGAVTTNTNAVHSFDYDIADKLKAHAERIRARIRKSTEDIIEIGRDLLAAQQHLLQRGQFDSWVEHEVGIMRRTAYAYMSAAKLYEKSATVALLPPATVYRLTARSVPSTVVEIVTTKAAAGEIVPDAAVKEMISEARSVAAGEQREATRREAQAKVCKRARQKRAQRDAGALKWKEEEAEREKADRRAIEELIAKIGIDAARAVHAALFESDRSVQMRIAFEAALAITMPEEPSPGDDPWRILDFLDRRKANGDPEAIRRALCRDGNGKASGPLAAALDLLGGAS
jgi:hypothetical protein